MQAAVTRCQILVVNGVVNPHHHIMMITSVIGEVIPLESHQTTIERNPRGLGVMTRATTTTIITGATITTTIRAIGKAMTVSTQQIQMEGTPSMKARA